jgi:hypothetical protein
VAGPRDVVDSRPWLAGHRPKEFLLADEHVGARTAVHRQAPSGSVSSYRLVGHDEERGGYVYRLVPRE